MVGGLIFGGGTGLYYYMNSHQTYNSSYASDRVRSAYAYVAGGLAITTGSSMLLFATRMPMVIMNANPLAYLFVFLATSIPLLIGTMCVDYHKNSQLKHALWGGFNITMACNLCIVGLYGGALVAQAALATGCIVGALSLVAMNSDPEKLSQFEGPLAIGLGVIVAAGLGNLFFPMPLLHNISLYGGLAVFSGLTLTDTNKLMQHAKNLSEDQFDPINESLGIYLDVLNIFIRVIQILADLEKGKIKEKK